MPVWSYKDTLGKAGAGCYVVASAEEIKVQEIRFQSLLQGNSTQICFTIQLPGMWSRGDEAPTFPMNTGNKRQERLYPSANQCVTGTELLAGVLLVPLGISQPHRIIKVG